MRPLHAPTGALFLSILITLVAACGPEVVRVTPAPTAPPATSAAASTAPATTPAATGTRTATFAPTAPGPVPTTTAGPGGTPASACPTQTGGSPANRALLTAVRVAHHDGYDRIVYEFSPSTGPGSYGVPPFTIGVASSFAGPSGQPVHVDGNAFLNVRFQNTDAHNDAGQPTIGSSDIKASDLRPSTTIIREVRLVEDFEAVVVWGVGLDHLVCPTVLTLAGPVRVVLDFATP